MQTIFITGTSSGIGKASAKLFSEKGWRVIATMRSPEKETELTQYENIVLYPLDVTNPEQVKTTIEKVLETEDVDVLFNNAGYGMKTKFEDMTEEMYKKSVDTNIFGMVRVTQAFIPYFKKKKSGTILTTTSLAGIIGLPLDGIYAADKWGQEGTCEMLYFELKPYNIRVKTLIPGAVKSNFKMDSQPIEGYDKIIQNQRNILIPDINEFETPEEAAQDAYFAVTDTDNERMQYPTGKVSKELCKKREELGSEKFRKYFYKLLTA